MLSNVLKITSVKPEKVRLALSADILLLNRTSHVC